MKQKIAYLAPAALTPHPRNSRKHSDAQIGQIAASIEEFGFTEPVLIDETNTILAGHGRVTAAARLGMGAVPCVRLSHLSDAQKRAYVIADNQIALNSTWDDALLRDELESLSTEGFAVDLLGFPDLDGLEDEDPLDDEIDDTDTQSTSDNTPAEKVKDADQGVGIPVPLLIDACPRALYKQFMALRSALKLSKNRDVLAAIIKFYEENNHV